MGRVVLSSAFAFTLMFSFWQENRATLRLAFPMMIGHLTAHLMHFTDLAMIGRVDVIQVSAATISTNLFNFFWLLGIGPVSAVSILVGEAHGAGDERRAREAFRGGLFSSGTLAIAITVFLIVVVQGTSWWHLGQPPEVIAEARNYLQYLALSTLPLLVFNSFKGYSEARGRPWLPLGFMMGSIFLNLVLNWLLIYGNLGFPRLELDGAGIATLLSRVIAMILLWWWMVRLPEFNLRWKWRAFWKPTWRKIWENIHLGLPIGFQILFEVSAFNLAVFMMGWLPNGTVAIAAHSIALGYAAMAFMIPLSVMVAVSIRVGQARGAGMSDQAVRIGWSAITMSATFMAAIGLVFVLGREVLPVVIIDKSAGELAPQVLALASHLLLFAAAFAVFDGIQVVATGALRGFRDVQFPTVVAFLAYWGLCLPIGFLIAFELDGTDALPGFLGALARLLPSGIGLGMGPGGVWVGLCIGLVVVAATFSLRLAVIARRARTDLSV